MNRIAILGLSLLISFPCAAMMQQQRQREEVREDLGELGEALVDGTIVVIKAPFKLIWALGEVACQATVGTYQWLTTPKPPKKPNSDVNVSNVVAANKAQLNKLSAQVTAHRMLAQATKKRYPANNAGAEVIRRVTVKKHAKAIWKPKKRRI